MSEITIDSFSQEAFEDPFLLLKELERMGQLADSSREGKSAEQQTEENIVSINSEEQYKQFIDEVSDMKMSFSYKPILIKAMMEYADVNGRASMSDIIDYYLNYFQTRADQGKVVEKAESTFVQHFGDRKAARRTILIYPYKRFEMKGMMKFDKANDQIEIVPPIWDNISNKIRRVVAAYCDAQLLRYYEKLETT